MAKKNITLEPTPTEAYFDVRLPDDKPYMNNVLLTFVHGIPSECHQYCRSDKHPGTNPATISNPEQRIPLLRDYVEQRLTWLARYEYLDWINGQQPFVEPRELQLWRLRIFVQFVWFWNLPADEELAMIFNLTKRRAANLAADFEARFRKTVIYPVALRRLYHLLLTKNPLNEKPEKNPKSRVAEGDIYSVPSIRYVTTAKNLVDDIRNAMPLKRMADPFAWDKEQSQMWIDRETLDVVKTDEALRERLFKMYKIPE
jgi:hypothetical protein